MNLCQNEYQPTEQVMKKIIHAVDSTTTISAQIEALSKQLAATQLAWENVAQLSRKWATQASSNENCKCIGLRNRVVPSIPNVIDEKKESGEVANKGEKEVVVEEKVEKNGEGEKI